jgi:hypothetical protein
MSHGLLRPQAGFAVPRAVAEGFAALAATVGATAVVLWLAWIAMATADATLGLHDYPNWPPYDLIEAWSETGASLRQTYSAAAI